MGFPRQDYCSQLPFPPPGDLPNPGIKPMSFVLACFTTKPPRKPSMICSAFQTWVSVDQNHLESLSNPSLLTPLPQDIHTKFLIQKGSVWVLPSSSNVMLMLPSGDHTLSSSVIKHHVNFLMSGKHEVFNREGWWLNASSLLAPRVRCI